MYEHFKDLADQLCRVPGGQAAILADYFGKSVTGPLPDKRPAEDALQAALGGVLRLEEAWALAAGGALCLAAAAEGAARLAYLHPDGGGATPILDFSGEVFLAARGDWEGGCAVSPLAIALLALAMGSLDDHRRLARTLPDVDYSAKGLLLIASCRLCG